MKKTDKELMTDTKQNYHIHISSDHNLFRLNLKEVWKYRDLIWLFTSRHFKLVYKQTILGPLWLIISPLLTSLIYTVVFGRIAGLSTAGVPQILFYLSSHAMWTFFANSLSSNASTFITNSAVFSKVYFPRLTVPISTVLSSIIQFGIQMILVVVLLVYFIIRGEVHPKWPLLPLIIPVIIVTGIMGLGLGILVSSVTTKYRDLALLVSFGLQLWMYASPVIYPMSQLGDSVLYKIMIVNPMTAPMEIFRLALMGIGNVNVISIVSSVFFAVLAALFGIIVFNKVERNFIDTV